jgi:hypothetical protein
MPLNRSAYIPLNGEYKIMEAKFYLNPNPDFPNMPCFSFINEEEQKKYWMISDIGMCDADYILDEVLPNLEKIRNGEKYWDTYRSPHYGYYDYYTFGGGELSYIDFYKDNTIITYDDGQHTLEIPSEEIYQFMMEWGKYLDEWRKR